MATMTVSIPDELKFEMNEFEEINWSGFIRKQIANKISKTKLKESIADKIDEDMRDGRFWVEKLKASRIERIKKLKSEGLI